MPENKRVGDGFESAYLEYGESKRPAIDWMNFGKYKE